MSRSKQDPFVINPPPSTNGGNLRQRFQKLEQQHPSQRLRTHSHRHFSNVFLPRVVDRNWPYHQSKNSIAVTNRNHQSGVIQLLMKDWFHVFLRMHVLKSITFLLGLWTSAILIFAAVYVRIDEAYLNQNCGLGDPGTPISFGTAFAFSLETCTTVGCKLQMSQTQSGSVSRRNARSSLLYHTIPYVKTQTVCLVAITVSSKTTARLFKYQSTSK